MIIIDAKLCKGCGICVHFCPKHTLEISTEVNRFGYYTPYVLDGSECSNCRQCELLCPDFAIFIAEDNEGADG